jgi:hypothetical protein
MCSQCRSDEPIVVREQRLAFQMQQELKLLDRVRLLENKVAELEKALNE